MYWVLEAREPLKTDWFEVPPHYGASPPYPQLAPRGKFKTARECFSHFFCVYKGARDSVLEYRISPRFSTVPITVDYTPRPEVRAGWTLQDGQERHCVEYGQRKNR